MFEKVNAMHPDKVADRIAGAMVDLAYGREDSPRVAVEVLIGHGFAYVIAESSVQFTHEDVQPIIDRNFLTALNYYTDLLTLNQQRDDRVPDHIDQMFQERYGFHFNRE